MLSLFKEQKSRQKAYQAVIFIIIIAVFFVGAQSALAADSLPWVANAGLGVVGMAVAQVFSLIALILTSVIGLLITVVVALVIQVAQYGNIINVPTVIQGWVIIRDLCNMSFILILLVIAFATILRQENFSAKKMLPKLLLMAILINFSRAIFGLLIDFSQVVMLTFVNAFAAGGGWFVDAFQISKLLTIKGDTTSTGNWAVSQWSTAMAVIAGVLAAIITLIVVSVILAVLVARIVMLWIYTIFSPLIFLGFAFPPLQKYTGKLWEDFTKQLVVGPVLAFFIWLALTTASGSSTILNQNLVSGISPTENNEVCVGAGAFFCTGQGGNAGSLQKFIIVIGLLMGGLMVAQEFGGAAGSIAGKGLDWAKKVAGSPGLVAKRGVFAVGRGLDSLQMKAQKGIMEKWFKVPDYHAKSLNYRMLAQGYNRWRADRMEQYETSGGKAPRDTVWEETFKKYLRFRQYGAVRKSSRRYAQDQAQAKKLVDQNDIDNSRIQFTAMNDQEQGHEFDKLKSDKGKQDRIKYYKDKGYDDQQAEAEVQRDIDILLDNNSFDQAAAKQRVAANEPEIAKLMDPRLFGLGLISAGKAIPFEFEKSKAGAQKIYDESTRDMSLETGEADFKVTSRFMKAVAEGKVKDIIAALRIQNKNNNFNELLKDNRVVDLMIKSNGLLEKLNRKGALGGGRVLSDSEIQALKDDFIKRPVTPAHVQALIRGVLANAGMKDNEAARHAADLGERSFVAGNGLAYGMAMGDVASGDYKFEDLNFSNGRLQTSQKRKEAVTAKFGNLESQARMKMSHPDLTISEAPDGSAVDLHEDGEYLIRHYSAHDLSQIGRMRPDNINKSGASPKVLEDIKRLADRVEQEVGKGAADLIRYYGGYIKNAKEKAKALKDYDEAIRAMDGTP
jgi:hypothetical protein